MKTKILDGKKISDILIKNIHNRFVKISNLNKYIGVPFITIIVVGNNYSSKIYIKNKISKILKIGFKTKIYFFKKNIKEEKIIKLIENLNNDKNIHGILVQLPLPKNINVLNIVSKINKYKDVDCLNPINLGNLCYKRPIFKPCTAYGIFILLKKYNLLNKKLYTVIIGSSNIVGKPIGIKLINYGCVVTIINKNCLCIKKFTKLADLLIVAAGYPMLIKKNFIKKGSIIIDVGINIINNKIVGDVDKEIFNKASYFSPVPGGIGPITISILLDNLLNAFIINNKKN